jgi:adenylate cyclase
VFAAGVLAGLPIYGLWSFLITAVEQSSDYRGAAVVPVVALPVLAYVFIRPGSGAGRLLER